MIARKLIFFLLLLAALPYMASAQNNLTDSIPQSDTSAKKINETLQQMNGYNQQLQLLYDSVQAKRKDSLNLENTLNTLRSATNQNLNLINQTDALLNSKKSELSTLSTDVMQKKIDSTSLAADIADKVSKTDSLKHVTDSLQTIAFSVQKSIDKLQANIALLEDSLEIIGTFKMDTLVSVRTLEHVQKKKEAASEDVTSKYYDRVHTSFKTMIRQIHITVKEGLAVEIIVNTDSGTFRNKSFMPDLVHFDNYRSAHLEYVNQKFRTDADDLFIFLDDALKYFPKRSFTDVAYGDFDVTLVKDSVHDSYDLKESTSINTYFNVAGFTDIKGISGEPNGIAQFTADAKFITQTKPLTTKFNKNGRLSHDIIQTSSWIFLNYISFKGGLAKFDENFKGTFLEKDSNKKVSVNRKDLLQRSNYYVGAKFNLFKIVLPPSPYYYYSHIELNAGYNFVGSRVFDTTLNGNIIDTAFRSITQNQFYIEPLISFIRHKNFSMVLSMPFEMINVKQSAQISNYKTQYWAVPGISLMYFGKKNAASKLFFRYNHHINLRQKTQAFSQLQLGVSLNLTQVWSSGNPS